MWEPESEDESLCVFAQACKRTLAKELSDVSEENLWPRSASLDLTWEWLPLFSAWSLQQSLFFQGWMKTETTDRKPGEQTLVAVKRAGWRVHNSLWKRNNLSHASCKTDPLRCQQLLKMRELTCCPFTVTPFIIVVVAWRAWHTRSCGKKYHRN